MTFVATLTVPAAKKTWLADEVPWLTANALCPVPDTPPLNVTDLLRIDSTGGRAMHSPLSDTDRAALDRHWKQCALPPIDRPMTSDEWVPYLEAFNEAPKRPAWADWVFAVRPPHDPNSVAEMAMTVIEHEHRARLRQAINNREVVARMAGTMVEAPSSVNLQRVVLTQLELERFCGLLCIEVVSQEAPNADGTAMPAPATYAGRTGAWAAATQEPAPDRGRRVKRAALIADNVRRWPTIERDLKDAATNGLSVAAKEAAAIGWWWEGSAITWARARAKVQDGAAPGIAGIAGTIHRMGG